MLLAAKYEEIYPSSILDFVYITDKSIQVHSGSGNGAEYLERAEFWAGLTFTIPLPEESSQACLETRPSGSASALPGPVASDTVGAAACLKPQKVPHMLIQDVCPRMCLVNLPQSGPAQVPCTVPKAPLLLTLPPAEGLACTGLSHQLPLAELQLCACTGYMEERLSPIMGHMAKDRMRESNQIPFKYQILSPSSP
ncbi:hypothetical protein E2320_013227 [Naja naja]|nr:hypothetical protein E2320_013227 [Naja naja]